MTLKEVKALKKVMARIKEENEILHQRRALAYSSIRIITFLIKARNENQ